LNLLVAIIVGAIAGTHISTWGMYKDSIHEGFTWPKYFRSIIIAAIIAVIIESVTGFRLDSAGDIVVFFGVVYAFERLTLELWKSFIRVEDQSKYFIPMQFGVKGKPIHDKRIRYSVGTAVLLVLVFAIWGVAALQSAFPDLPPWLVLVTIGSLGGWLTAFGGAWKDAPVEGFETFKFFRSPGVTLFWAVLLAFFTDNWLYIGIGAAGYSVVAIETYKTFFFPSKPRGKFAGKPIDFPEMLKKRQYFVPVYVLIWILIFGAFAVAFSTPHEGLYAAAPGSPAAAIDHTLL
jgi:NADH:ubiquinone oxidoreductase subunit 6 (subunit J)